MPTAPGSCSVPAVADAGAAPAHASALKWVWLSLAVVAADQLTKLLATASLAYGQPLPLMPGVNLTLLHNTGAAFSVLSDAGGWQRWLLAALALIASSVILAWLRSLRASRRWLAAALALILGGALGNLWDRLLLGYVIDFIDLYYGHWHWPAFNLADSAISTGAVMLVVDAFRTPERRR